MTVSFGSIGSGGNRYTRFEYAFPSIADLRAKFAFYGAYDHAFSVAGAAAIYGTGPGGTKCHGAIPLKLAGVVGSRKNQFVEIVLKTNTAPNANVTRPYIGVCGAGGIASTNNNFTNYGLLIRMEAAANDAQIIKSAGFDASLVGAITTTVLDTIAAPSLGDTIRLAVTFNAAGNPELEAFYNGVSQGAAVEDAGGLTTGLPFIGARDSAVGAGDSFSFSDLVMGVAS